jgi:5-methyltetrahydrofolate--homocysteine methyltransferase
MTLEELAKEKVLILDGAMGTMIQRYNLTESDYRGDRFADWPSPLQGNNDLISLSQPDILKAIHKAYLEAGADLLETNTFNSNAISMADYHMEHLVTELNAEAVKLAKAAIAEYQQETENRPAFVVGSIGPTNRTASISPDVSTWLQSCEF